MMRRNNYDEPSRLAKERRVVKVPMEGQGEVKGVAAIVKSKQPSTFVMSWSLTSRIEN
jgi:hypothetical protein